MANNMVENVIGTYSLPFGIATNFRVNGKDYLIPMVTEEPSVIAAASYGAKLARESGGFFATGSEPIMISQIQLVDPAAHTGSRSINWGQAVEAISQAKSTLINLANAICPNLCNYGGGVKDLETRIINTVRGEMLVVQLIVNVGGTMGANILAKMAEGITPMLEKITGAKSRLRILSNLPVHRIFRAEAIWTKQQLEASAKGMTGEEVIEGILDSWALADADPFRATTNNKGVMNGIDAVTLATGNDCRAVESAAHGYASFTTQHYTSLTSYEKTPEGNLKGKIEVPLTLGMVGGVTQVHPMSRLALKILGVDSPKELGCIVASVGLAQNFAALRAMITEGITRGHMKLHAKNVAIQGGVNPKLVDVVANLMALENNISPSRAREIMMQICHVM
jgi:hydroxymethylglutaryl-CoA reductase